MGKNLKGKEIGKGIHQRKDGKYSARYCAKDGKRHEKYFNTYPKHETGLQMQNTKINTALSKELLI